MIERHNILELFGADKNKYHSCIITCYSFDFMFFEQRVIPRLRQAGMININVFVDANMYEQQLSSLDGKYILKQSYSLIPIQLKGAFHPKILMGFGKNNGFLAIGSGNLTNSGLSSNDEIWGAFHTYKNESKALPLFNSAYNYLKTLQKYCYGSNIKKWSWLEKASPWLSDLSNSVINEKVGINNEKLFLTSSFGDASIYKNILDNLPSSELDNITIVSPFYNKNGTVITNLIKDLNPKTVDIVVDSRFGTVPYLFVNDPRVQFHEWQTVKKTKGNGTSRLHAKILQFKYANKTCIVTGSANATVEALGTKVTDTKNAEMSMFMVSNVERDWLKELEITVPEKGDFDLNNFMPKAISTNDVVYKKHEYFINHAELDLTQIFVYFDCEKKLPVDSFVEIETINSTKSLYQIKVVDQNPLIFEINEADIKYGFKLCILDGHYQKISNYAKLTNTQLILRTNPDSKSTRILEILNGTELNDSDLITLLEFANFEKDTSSRDSRGSNKYELSKNEEHEQQKYDHISEEEFNKNEHILEYKYKGAGSNLSMLEDFLNNMVFGGGIKEDFLDSKERAAEDAISEGISDDDSAISEYVKLSFHEGQRIRNKIHQTLIKIHEAFSSRHINALTDIIGVFPVKEKASIEDIKSTLVGTHLIFMKYKEYYQEERIKVVVTYGAIEDLADFENTRGIGLKRLDLQKNVKKKEVAYSADANILKDVSNLINKNKGIRLVYFDETPSIVINHYFFKSSPVFSNKGMNLTSIKGFLINTVSPVLLLLANGTEEYDNQELKEFNIFKKRLFYRVLLLILNTNWKNKEQDLLELFILNVIFHLMPESSEYKEVLEEIELVGNMSYILESELEINHSVVSSILLSYLQWKSIYDINKKDLIKELDRNSVGRIIYKSKFGFAKITSSYKGVLNLTSPLGFFNKDHLTYEIKNIRAGSKAIMY